MPRIGAAAQRLCRETIALLQDPATAARRTTDLVVPPLARLLHTDVSMGYTVALGDSGPVLESAAIEARGGPEPLRASLREIVATPGAAYYRPLRPQPAQRNRVLTTAELLGQAGRSAADGFPEPYRKIGFHRLDQIRVLVCEGPLQLAWVGGLRERPFGWTDRALLAQLVPTLHRRLLMERRMGLESLGFSAVEATLAALAAPALFVAGRPGALRIVHANALATAQLDARRGAVLGELDAALRCPAAPSSWTLTSVGGAADGEGVYLAVRRVAAVDPGPRLAAARGRLSLTDRQVEVLERVVRGESNKEVAAWLGCSESTVEVHVTALLRRTGLASRVELVARFWTDRL